MRVVRDNGGGLWTLEADDGQLYLAVLSMANTEFRRKRLEEARAEGFSSRFPRSGIFEEAPPPAA